MHLPHLVECSSHLQLVALEPRPLLRADPRGARHHREGADGFLADATLAADVVGAARVVALLDCLDLHDAACGRILRVWVNWWGPDKGRRRESSAEWEEIVRRESSKRIS